MASHTVAFNVNSATMERIVALQKRRRRGAISVDLFCKQLVFEALDAADRFQDATGSANTAVLGRLDDKDKGV